ncbi:hypothetical protein D3C71_2001760 [compost metagenome]
MQTACGIDDDIIVIVILGLLQRLLRDLDRTHLVAQREYRHFDLFAENLQLLDRGRTVNIARYE